MAKAKKTPNGKWKIRVYDYTDSDGNVHVKAFTADTKKDVELMAAKFNAGKSPTRLKSDITFGEALSEYIDSRVNVVSPSTIRGYKQMRSYYEPLLDLKLKNIDQLTITRFINQFAADHKPKTVSNCHGLISAVLKVYNPDLTLKTKLPQKTRITYKLPTDENLKALITYYKENDHDMLVAVYLAAFGTMRRSEICALTAKDVKDNIIHISKGMKLDDSREWVVCQPKTRDSDRYVTFPDFVIQELPKKGKLVNIHPDAITHRFGRTLKRLDIPHFRFHDLRHYAASILHAIGIPDQYIMEMGGWHSDKVLKEIYRGTLDEYQKNFTEKAVSHFDKFK